MPWKTTKLKFFGVPLRRRTLYVMTLALAIACVPLMSWSLLALGGNYPGGQKTGVLVASIIILALALNGWRLILKHNTILYWEEARVVWPGSIVLLLAAIWLSWSVADSVIKRDRMDYIVPLTFGGALLVVLLVRWAMLGRHVKRSSVVRGDSGRRHSRSGLPAASPPEEKVAEPAVEDDDVGPEPPADGSVS